MRFKINLNFKLFLVIRLKASKNDIKVFGLSNDEYSLAKLLSKEELKMFDTRHPVY